MFRRKAYEKLLSWKEGSRGSRALLLEGARRTGKSTLARAFAENEYAGHLIIDFSEASEDIKDLFQTKEEGDFVIHCISFGFKYGIPMDADLVLDVRCLPNPFYLPELREKTGLDSEVQRYVLNSEKTTGFLQRFYDLVDYMLPLYRQEQKSQLLIAVGCTGGRHRSVTVIQELTAHLRQAGYRVCSGHRDIEKKRPR